MSLGFEQAGFDVAAAVDTTPSIVGDALQIAPAGEVKFRGVAQWMGSCSTAAATSNPALLRYQPRGLICRRPAPANRSTPIGLLSV